MKGKIWLILAVFLLPGALSGQVTKPAATEKTTEFTRYEVFGGVAYSGANQVKSSSSLIGFNAGAQVKAKKWFGGVVDFGQYTAYKTSGYGVLKPTVTTVLAGPEFSIPSGNLTGFLHVLFGGAHTGNSPGEKPDISFAYAVGVGLEYEVSSRFSARVTGDGVVSSFVLDPNNLGYSPHARTNPRATAGVAYHF